MHFDWTVSVGDIMIVLGGAITFLSSTVVLLYRICQRLDRIEAMATTAAQRTATLDMHAIAAVAAATGAAVATNPTPKDS